MILYSLMEVLVVGGGMLCLAILIIRRKHNPQRDPDAMVAGPTPAGSALRGFFSPLMIVFWVICVGEMVLWTVINLV
jgi:hypothetical protein